MMQVETFEVEEAATATGTTPEIEAEALGLIEKLGLAGQRSLLVKPEPASAEEVARRVQYPKMTAAELVVYGTLFPGRSPVADYAAGPIPVRVLQVIAHAAPQFDKLVVWHARVPNPDPVLVGVRSEVRGTAPLTWTADTEYLLARWGTALAPFAELSKAAERTLVVDYTRTLKAKIREAQRQLADVDALAAQRVAGEYVGL